MSLSWVRTRWWEEGALVTEIPLPKIPLVPVAHDRVQIHRSKLLTYYLPQAVLMNAVHHKNGISLGVRTESVTLG